MTACQLDTCACVATIKFLFFTHGVCYQVEWTDCVVNNILWSISRIFEGVTQNWMQATFGQLSINRIKKSLSMKWCIPLSGEIPQQLLMRQLRHHTNNTPAPQAAALATHLSMVRLHSAIRPADRQLTVLHKYHYTWTLESAAMRHDYQRLVGDATRFSVVGEKYRGDTRRWKSVDTPSVAFLHQDTPGEGSFTLAGMLHPGLYTS